MSDTITVDASRLRAGLAALRYSIVLVMAMWTADKFINPDHSALVFEVFYRIPGLEQGIFMFLGIAQGLLVLAFALGIFKRWSTLALLLMHTVSTLSPMARYFDPWTNPNLLFFAAWPMLAGLIMLYLLRDHDSLGCVGESGKAMPDGQS